MSDDLEPRSQQPSGPPPQEESGHQHASVFYEAKDVWVRLVIFVLAALLITIVACGAVVWGLYSRWSKEKYGTQPAAAFMRQYTQEMVPPKPRLQSIPSNPVSPPEQLREMREQMNHVLNSYGWVDQQLGVARIPISEAMKLLAQEGLGPKTEPHPKTLPNLSASR